MISMKKIIGIIVIVLIVAITANTVNSYCSTKEVTNNPNIRVSTSYIVTDDGNFTKVEDPKTQRSIKIKNTGTFEDDYDYCTDIVNNYNQDNEKDTTLSQQQKESYKANISEIKTSNGIEMFNVDDGGATHQKVTIYNVNGKTGNPSSYSYPIIKNNIFFKQLTIN
jgi:hypothetical protein